jgi:hypothetical protein
LDAECTGEAAGALAAGGLQAAVAGRDDIAVDMSRFESATFSFNGSVCSSCSCFRSIFFIRLLVGKFPADPRPRFIPPMRYRAAWVWIAGNTSVGYVWGRIDIFATAGEEAGLFACQGYCDFILCVF